MAFTAIPNLSPPSFTRLHLLHQSSHKPHSAIHHNNNNNHGDLVLQPSSPPLRLTVSPPPPDPNQADFYVNLGLALRTLRHDLPLIFSTDPNYQIYRDDITFVDPLNKFSGIDNYRLLFRALRFHGRIMFKQISLELFRVWQPSQNLIFIRWNLKGVPRVPWEPKGEFQGTSRYKLDRNGKIYEHRVDNLAFNFPQQPKPAAVSVLDLVTAGGSPTFSWDSTYSCSWTDFYRAVKNTVDPHHEFSALQDCQCQLVATCL